MKVYNNFDLFIEVQLDFSKAHAQTVQGIVNLFDHLASGNYSVPHRV